jgi:hypothetical protein
MTVRRFFVATGVALTLAVASHSTAIAQNVDNFSATSTGYFLSGKREIPVSRAISYDLTTERALARKAGVVVAGSGGRPAIATVRSTGATICRTPGIVPPLGVGRFGEPSIGGLPFCSSAPGQPAPVQPPPTPLEAAYYAWLYVIDLPSPTASTQPSVGITGLDTFLTIQGQQGMVLDVPALGYDVHFEISSVYDVDWGDPRPDGTKTGAAVTRNHKDQGGPYPDGTLRHQYIERGAATITITQRWSATWSAAGDGGSLPDSVETTGSLTLPIQEIQAVVTG